MNDDEGLTHLDENPEDHIGEELPDPWDDETQTGWRRRAEVARGGNDLAALIDDAKVV
jgi:hypothetical protein